MSDREKLVELIGEAERNLWGKNVPGIKAQREYIADYLISHGVTVQEWISFDEVKPNDGQSVLGISTEGEIEVHQFYAKWENCLCQYGGNVKTFNITHWMPLPPAQKGEKE